MSFVDVVERMGESAKRAGRAPENVKLVAVSKTKSVEEILKIYEQGQRDFGENRAQELAEKAPLLPSDIRWHFVGALQSNKTRLVRPIAHLLHSMDRKSLAKAWLKGPGLAPPVLAEINIGEEQQKSGISPGEALEMLDWMTGVGLRVDGLMAIPPAEENPEKTRIYFRRMKEIFDNARHAGIGLSELSMGMTDDFEIAIEEGASIIRVGRAIFGPRN